MAKKLSTTIEKRVAKDKQVILENLKQVPIIQVACQKSGIGRASYYRWRKGDKSFAKKADEAVHEGRLLINEMAESQLINSIKEQNMTGIIFWLKNNNPVYGDKVELTHKAKNKKLTPDQEKLIDKALRLASLVPKQK